VAALATVLAPAQAPAAELESTRWKLVEVAGRPAGPSEAGRWPYIELRAAEKPGDRPSLRGSGGCNRLAGSYRLDGSAVEFGPVASTRMACAQGMEQEQAVLEALAGTRMWKILARLLELCDKDGTMLARFEARDLK
jgi:heat shock protein HslJ